MSLMSVREKLNNAALEDGASKEDLLRAALAAIDILPTAKAGGFLDTDGICLR